MNPRLRKLLEQARLSPADQKALRALVKAEQKDLVSLCEALKTTKNPTTRCILQSAIVGQRKIIAVDMSLLPNATKIRARVPRKRRRPGR